MNKLFTTVNRKSIIFATVVAFLLILAVGSAVLAQNATQNATPEASKVKRETAVMQAFLQDRQPAENLAPMTETPCVGGDASGYPCSNIDLLAFMPLASIGGGNGNDIWGWTDPQNGKEYALMGRTNGTAFVDISDPVNPVYLGNLPGHNNSTSSWRDIKVYANHAFIVSEASGHGMQVFDLSNLRTVVNPPVTFSETAHYSGFGNAHNIVLNEKSGFAYGVGTSTCSGGLHAVDISTPTSPTSAGCFSSDGYTHDAQCVIYNGPDLEHIGKEVCFNANEDTVTIVDMSDKANPNQLSRSGYSGSRYTHQAWLSEDQAVLLVNDELDEQNNGHNTRTYMWDITNLDSPSLIGNHTAVTPAIDHNLYTRGNLVFESNYRAGLRILDISAAASGSMSEVGYFDIYPTSNSASFNGTWSNYPYFDSNVVIVSGIEQGLFILEPNMAADFRMEPTAVALNICGAGSDSTTFNLDSLYDYSSSVSMSVSGVPTGATSSFSNSPLTPTDSTDFEVTNASAADGEYLLTVTATDGSISYAEYLKLTIASSAAAPTLTTPANNATNVSNTPTLMWTAVPGASSYDIEIATDINFTNIVDSATGISGTSYNASLAPNTQYFWRVRTNNFCSTSGYSAAYNFTTGAAPSTVCSSPNMSIPDNNPAGAQDIINAANTSNINDLNLYLKVNHTWVGDTIFKLEHENTGTTVTFIDRPGLPANPPYGCSSNNIDASIDDEGSDGSVETTCYSSSPAISGSLTPFPDALSAFDGENMNGNWILTASDHFSGDTGTVVEWCIVVDANVCAVPTAVNDVSSAANGNDVKLTWTDTGADFYDVWSSSNAPYFTPGVSCALSANCTTVTTNNHSATGNIGNPAENISYLVVARSSCGATAAPSNLTGEFDFALEPGTP